MATAVPSSPPDDLFSITVERAKAWGVALGSYIGSIAALIGGYYGLKNLFPDWSDALVVGIAAIPLVLALVTITLPTWLRRRRDRKLIEQGVSGALQNPGYFRIQPYAAEDRERFWRPDGAQDDVLNWILNAESPVLYLTGRSGTGKSSLLNAWVLPKLRENDLPFQALVVRSYRDPLAALGVALGKPGIVWEKPPGDLPTDERARLERAAAYLRGRRRLLTVFDQFEEFVILQEPERRARLNAFLRELIERPVPAVTALLVMRSDYLGALDQLDLPVLRQRDNWREVGAFTQSAAAAFLDRSGLQLGPELRVEILREAGEVEENPGLIRPITLNMFGLVLGRFEGTLPKGFAAGRLLTGYLQDALKDAGEHAVPIVRRMVSDVATKQPRSEADLAKATGLSPHLVRGCLLALGSRGLVRPIDQTSRVWEIAHDFVARLLAQVVSRWRAPWWRMARPWIAPSSLALWLAVVFAALPAYRTYVAENPFRALRAMDIQVTGADDSYRVEFPALSNEAADALLRGAATHLKELGAFHLDLSVAQVHKDLLSLPLEGITGLVPLTQLTNMRVLDLSGNPVVDLAPLADLPALHTLNLSGTLVSDLAPLSNLTGLKKLDLSATWVTDLAPVGNLTALQSLALMTEISDLTPLADLTSLRELHLFKTQGDLAPLGNLTSLETLSLLGARISDLSALANLPALDTLSLMYSEIADLTPLVDLAALQSLDLSAAKVAEEDVEALRRAFIQRGQEVKISSGNLRQPGDGPYPFPAGVRGGSERGGGLAD